MLAMSINAPSAAGAHKAALMHLAPAGHGQMRGRLYAAVNKRIRIEKDFAITASDNKKRQLGLPFFYLG